MTDWSDLQFDPEEFDAVAERADDLRDEVNP